MLIPATALLLQHAAPPPPAPEDEITVVGRRMRNLRFAIRRDRRGGGHRCVIRRGMGDPLFDARVCDVALDCYGTGIDHRQLKTCLKPRLTALVERYWRERRSVSAGPAAR